MLLLDKPSGITSNAALQRVKRALQAERAGHTGTLDPLASGLLPIALGEATKFAGEMLDADKAYAAKVHLGVRTRTGDAEGEVLETREVHATRVELETACVGFSGRISQIPPMYSALKRDGRALYEYARAGVEVERAPREVIIHRIAVLAFEVTFADLEIDCSKGTYVRTLAEDIGAALGCGAHLAALRRTRVGALDLARAVALDALEAMAVEQRVAWVLPIERFLDHHATIELDEGDVARLRNGRAIEGMSGHGTVRIYSGGGDARFLGLGEIGSDQVLRPLRLIRTDRP